MRSPAPAKEVGRSSTFVGVLTLPLSLCADIYTGDSIDVAVIDSDGVRIENFPLKKD